MPDQGHGSLAPLPLDDWTAHLRPCLHYQQRGFTLDRQDRHIATVLTGIKRKHTRPPVHKEAIQRDDILAMVATLPYDLRGLRDRAMLLPGYAGGLRRSEIVSLDVH